MTARASAVTARAVLLALASLAAVGCKRAPSPADPAPTPSASVARPTLEAGLPLARNASPRPPALPTVSKRGASIFLDETDLGPPDAGTGAIPRLRDALQARRDAAARSQPGAPFVGAVIVSLDGSASLALLRRVGESMVAAGHGEARLLVRTPTGGEGVLDLALPVPGAHSHPHTESVLFVLARGGTLRLVWKNPEAVFWTHEVPGPEDLGPLLHVEWAKHGAHKAVSDRAQDRVVLVFEVDEPVAKLTAIVDELVAVRRRVGFGQATGDIPVFTVALAAGRTVPLPEDMPR